MLTVQRGDASFHGDVQRVSMLSEYVPFSNVAGFEVRPTSDVTVVSVDDVDGDTVVTERAVVATLMLVCRVETVRCASRVRVLYSDRLRRAVYKQCLIDVNCHR